MESFIISDKVAFYKTTKPRSCEALLFKTDLPYVMPWDDQQPHADRQDLQDAPIDKLSNEGHMYDPFENVESLRLDHIGKYSMDGHAHAANVHKGFA
jgi:hypothetical protein